VQVPHVQSVCSIIARAADTDRPGDPHGGDAGGQTQIRTFLIADVRGYTLFTQERGDEVAAKLAAKLADITREIVEARAGALLELRGDEALCVSGSTREAIRAAVDDAVQAPITNPLSTHAVSDRVENVQVHLQWGLMLSLILGAVDRPYQFACRSRWASRRAASASKRASSASNRESIRPISVSNRAST
jgi:class 3 adenylate cyclase